MSDMDLGEAHEARWMVVRPDADAHLALALTREARTREAADEMAAPVHDLASDHARVANARAGAVEASPDDLAEAKRFLDAAERWHVDAPSSEEARNLTYVAQRKAQIDPFAAVSETGGGMAVTVADSVLIEGDTARLMATARERLDRVAQALQAVRGRSISVKACMDASGDAAHATDLARRRADAVRQYLVGRGIAKDRLRAFGLLATPPPPPPPPSPPPPPPMTADTSAPGRHEDRRVEIVVERTGQDTATH